MAIECCAVGKGKGTKSEKQSEQKGFDDTHLEEMPEDVEGQEAEKSREESGGKKGAYVGTVEDLSLLVVREKVLQEVFSWGERRNGHERKTR
jgi:hypothetical protein